MSFGTEMKELEIKDNEIKVKFSESGSENMILGILKPEIQVGHCCFI